jgi:hypothetical protein
VIVRSLSRSCEAPEIFAFSMGPYDHPPCPFPEEP